MIKAIKLKYFYALLVALVMLIGGFYYYLYSRVVPAGTTILPLMADFQRPKFLFNIHGAIGVRLVRPMNVFFDDVEKLIYISNTEGHTIDVFNWQGEYLFSFGGFGSAPGKLSFPYGVTRTSGGDLLVAEAGNLRVQRFSAKGEYLSAVFSQPNEYGIEKPGPLQIDAKGNIYIGDLSGGKVVVLNKQGKLHRTIGPVAYPHGIAIDEKNNRVFIASAGSKDITVFPLDNKSGVGSKFIKTPSDREDSGFAMVRGIAVDKRGRLFVVDSMSSSVRVFDSAGEYLFSFGKKGNDNGAMMYPNGIDVDESGRIYIADWANNRVVVWGY